MDALQLGTMAFAALLSLGGGPAEPIDHMPPTKAISWALRQVGTPYHYGGDCTAPHSGVGVHQCDCSSLVQQAFKAAGINLPRTARQQVLAGRPIHGLAQLRPGDLLFVRWHVGIYLGEERVLHAPRSGAEVEISALQGYWSENVTAIRRV